MIIMMKVDDDDDVTMMVSICGDDCDLVMNVILVKEVMSCDVSPVAMFKLRGGGAWRIFNFTVSF